MINLKQAILTWTGFALSALAMVLVPAGAAHADKDKRRAPESKAPEFSVDANWPKTLPNNWVLGQVGGIAVDRHDHIWIIQRPRSLTSDEAAATGAIATICSDGTEPPCAGGAPSLKVDSYGNPRPDGPLSDCCYPAPPVLVFDKAGNLLKAWAGEGVRDYDPFWNWPAPNCVLASGCEWPAGEHGIYVDHNDNVYIAGNGNGNGSRASNFNNRGFDGQVLKFAADGTFLLEIGKAGNAAASSNDIAGGMNGTPQLWRPADMEVDPQTNELYIADGYGNHRVVVVDADTGLYKRRWGAYGQNPVDDTPSGPYAVDRDAGTKPANFRNPVHCVRITNDGKVYVCDRVNDRIQVFDKYVVGAPCVNSTKSSGTCGFLGEKFVDAATLLNGAVWDLDTSADRKQSCLYNADGSNQRVDTLYRDTLEVIDQFGTGGRSAGQFHWVHNLATDSRGNIYTAEVDTGKRAQRFEQKGRNDCRIR